MEPIACGRNGRRDRLADGAHGRYPVTGLTRLRRVVSGHPGVTRETDLTGPAVYPGSRLMARDTGGVVRHFVVIEGPTPVTRQAVSLGEVVFRVTARAIRFPGGHPLSTVARLTADTRKAAVDVVREITGR